MNPPPGYEWHQEDALELFCQRCETVVSADVVDLHEREYHTTGTGKTLRGP